MGFEADFAAAMEDFKKLEEKIQKKAMRRAVAKAARIVAKDLKNRVNKDTGTLRDSITYKVTKGKKNSIKAVVGAANIIKRGKGKTEDGASRYFHLSESEGLTGDGAKKESAKRVAEKIQAALDSTKGRAEAAIISEIQAELERGKS